MLFLLFLTIFESLLLSHYRLLYEIYPFIILIFGVVFLLLLTHGGLGLMSQFRGSPRHWADSKAQPSFSEGAGPSWVSYQCSSRYLSN